SSSGPPVATAPRGRRPTGLFGFLPQLAGGVARSAEGEWHEVPRGSGTKCRGGAVRRTARELQGVSWLASLAPPPRLRPYSPVSLALHGGEGHGVGMDARIVGVNSATVSPCSPARWTASGSRPSLASRIRYASKNACGASIEPSNEDRKRVV